MTHENPRHAQAGPSVRTGWVVAALAVAAAIAVVAALAVGMLAPPSVEYAEASDVDPSGIRP